MPIDHTYTAIGKYMTDSRVLEAVESGACANERFADLANGAMVCPSST